MQPSSAAGGGQADLQGACIHRVWGEGSAQLQDVKCSTHAAQVEETLGHHRTANTKHGPPAVTDARVSARLKGAPSTVVCKKAQIPPTCRH